MNPRQIRDLDVNIHNKPIDLGPYVPTSWNHRDIVLAHALSSSCIGLAKEEDRSTDSDWKLSLMIEKVPVWHEGASWYVQLSESFFRFYSLIQPEMEITVTTSPKGKSVLLHPEWRDSSSHIRAFVM